MWRIVAANEEFCRALRVSAAAVMGRDVRELVRKDWQSDFSSYVAKALVRAGDGTITLPIVRPREEPAWFMHTLEVIEMDGAIGGYRAWMVPHLTPAPRRRWLPRGHAEVRHVWNFEPAADDH